MKGRGRLSLYLAAAALAWSVSMGLVLYFAPLTTSVTTSSDGTSVTTSERIFSSPAEAWALLVPMVLCAVACGAAAGRRRRLLSAAFVVLALFCFISGFSIGLFYLPAVALLVIGILISRPAGPA